MQTVHRRGDGANCGTLGRALGFDEMGCLEIAHIVGIFNYLTRLGCFHISFSRLARLKPAFASWCPAIMLARSKYAGLNSTSGSWLQSPACGSHGSTGIPSAT